MPSATLFYKDSGPFGKTENCVRAEFISCSGVTKRVIRLAGGKRYQFALSQRITKGTISVEIRGRRGENRLKLDGETPTATISAEKGKRYRVVIRFVKADGEYTLRWDAA